MEKVITKLCEHSPSRKATPPHFRVFSNIHWVTALFFTAEGGHSKTPDYLTDSGKAGLNCSLGSPEDDETKRKNRMAIARTFNLRSADAVLTTLQAHLSVRTVDRPWIARGRPTDNAMVTSELYGHVLGVLACDCAPVLFADTAQPIVAVAHIGHHQAIHGLIEQTLDTMERQGSRRENIEAAVGPCIGVDRPLHVGENFIQSTRLKDPSIERFFLHAGRDACGGASFWFQDYLVARLKAAHVGCVTRVKKDTFADPDCYSRRRGAAPSSLMFSGIMLNELRR